ncbi:MAG: carboxypeptidase-like regulatory domain-containing protein [Chitinophagales bacterium]|nr:carboxypeptidase-like regulatory domain-containing protein [Chitinophagales bacterium]
MSKLSLFVLLLSTFSIVSFAQTINGTIADLQTKQVLPFVNIGIVGRDVGTVSDENGHFALSVPNIASTDTLRLSMVGYTTQIWVLADFLQKHEAQSTIYLTPANVELATVTIRPRYLKTRILGSETENKAFTAGFKINDLGSELGVLIKTKKTPTFVRRFNCFVAHNSYDTLFFRVNIYDTQNGKPTHNLLSQNVFVEKVGFKSGWISIDLSPYTIEVQNDFVVSLEWVKDLDPNVPKDISTREAQRKMRRGEGLSFSVTPLGAPILYRKASQGTWEKLIAPSIGFNVEVEY